MSAFFEIPLPPAFEEHNINTQMNQSQWAFVIKWVCRWTNFSLYFSVEMWLLDATEAFVDGESRLEFQKVIGYHQGIRGRFGLFKIPSIPHRNSPKHRRLISDLVPEVDANTYQAKSLQLHLQCYWSKWCDFANNGLSWKTLQMLTSSLISFCLGATFDTL